MSVHRALNKVIALYPSGRLNYKVYDSVSTTDKFWIVEVHNTDAPESLLQIEVFDDNGIPKCCVTKKLNVGRKSMFKFMNQFVDALEESRFSEPTS